jgi:molybdate transport system regulatory protein
MKRAPLIRFRIDFAEDANIGPGKIALIEGIKAHGSLSAAARAMGLSYRRAWLLLDSLNKSFDVSVTINTVGGRGGGGVQVTDFGLLLVSSYRKVEQQFTKIAVQSLKPIRAHVRQINMAAVRRVPMGKKHRRRPE